MRFADPLVPGTLILREKRFLAHVRLHDGRVVIAHTNNTGAMAGCSEPGSRVWLSPAHNPSRKLAYTWELVEVPSAPSTGLPVLAGIHTALANRLAVEAVNEGILAPLGHWDRVRTEVRFGAERSRVDLLLERGPADAVERCFVEVKNVTLARPDGSGAFPDAVTERGRKHLRELSGCVASGDRAALLFVVQRGDIASVRPADAIDPAYGAALRAAAVVGVQLLALRCLVTTREIRPLELLPVQL